MASETLAESLTSAEDRRIRQIGALMFLWNVNVLSGGPLGM